jgi:protein-disulfide isomerase
VRAARRALAATAVAVALLTGAAGCALLGGDSSVPVATAKPPTGTDGAVDFDGRFLSAGNGEKTVDIWFDAMCPVCGAFEKANGETLAGAVNDDEITLRLHPLTFLDRASNGTGYSTRAAAALVCVGVHDPSRVLDYYQALFTDQPEEGSSGLTDEQLAKRASDLGIADISGCIERSDSYQAWAQANTAHSQQGPIEVDGKKVLDRIEGTPTVLVNGKQYTGSISDAKKFEDFLASH